jgi:hypothetical protein
LRTFCENLAELSVLFLFRKMVRWTVFPLKLLALSTLLRGTDSEQGFHKKVKKLV